MQEVFYEESVDTHNQSSAKKKFTLFRVVSIISFICGAFSIVLLLKMRVPESGIGTPQIIMIVFLLVVAAGFFVSGGLMARKKHGFFLSYDYTFVSGELRISKVFNNRRRKNLYRLTTDRVIKVGRVGSDSYEKVKRSPDTKEDICTPNTEADDDKEFFYIHAQTNVGKKVIVLECRPQLVLTVVRYINRPGILEPEFNKQTIRK